MKSRTTLLLASTLAFLLVASLAQADGTGLDAKTALERLKGLAGSWEGTIGTPEGPATKLRYEVTAGGNAVVETLFADTPHEMVSVYTLDGEKLVMTHYCVSGNHPRLRLDGAASTADKLAFVYESGTNMDPGKGTHVHAGSIEIQRDGGLANSWTFFTDGKPAAEGAKLLLKRVGS